jgi:DNA-3-methyladenine glycosylase
LPLDEAPFALFASDGKTAVVSGVRIGLTKAADKPWRYGLKGSPFLSKPFPGGGKMVKRIGTKKAAR